MNDAYTEESTRRVNESAHEIDDDAEEEDLERVVGRVCDRLRQSDGGRSVECELLVSPGDTASHHLGREFVESLERVEQERDEDGLSSITRGSVQLRVRRIEVKAYSSAGERSTRRLGHFEVDTSG